MAYTAASFNRAPHGTARAHVYTSADAIATIIVADYFVSEADFLTVGDVIIAVGAVATTPTVDVLVVSKVVTGAAAEVDVINGT